MWEKGLSFDAAADRGDRLVAVRGPRAGELVAQTSWDGGRTWVTATMYPGESVDDWLSCDLEAWNRAAVEGRLPPGEEPCVWNPFFDLRMPSAGALLRLVSAAGVPAVEQEIDLAATRQVFTADAERAADLAGGALPPGWRAAPAPPASLWCPPHAMPLVLDPGLEGWYRIYVGMEPFSAVDLSISGQDLHFPVPDYQREPRGPQPQRRDHFITCADLTGRRLCLAPGNTRFPRDLSVRYVRCVPMADEEVDRYRRARRLAAERGRAFAAYMEQVTPPGYDHGLTLTGHTHDDMRLNRYRGATEVRVHVIRAGSKAWYHSDVVERFDGEGANPDWRFFGAWMAEADPLSVAIEEAAANGLDLFPDMGMNITYQSADERYRGLTEATILENPDMVCPGMMQFMDYRNEKVRAYVTAIARELMTKYDVAGINLDFARFAYRKSFDEESLVEVMKGLNQARAEAQEKWGHAVIIATRIPSYLYMTKPGWETYRGEYPEFTAALGEWAKKRWIDRVMVCAMNPEDLGRLSLERYKRAIEGSGVELWGDLYAVIPGKSPSFYLDVARRWVDEGLDGGFFIYSRIVPIEFFDLGWKLRLVDTQDIERRTPCLH